MMDSDTLTESACERETETLKQCSRCKTTKYCSEECQRADWPSHKLQCKPPSIEGIVIGCNDDRRGGPFRKIDIQPTHPIYIAGQVCPVSRVVGLPLVIYRHMPAGGNGAGSDNTIATFLMIDPNMENGEILFASWQRAVGTVTVMRLDGKPLSPEAIETIWMYHDHLLDVFSEGRTPRVTPNGFRNYCQEYKNERLQNGYNAFSGMPVPL